MIRNAEKERLAIEIAPPDAETDERFAMRVLWRLGCWCGTCTSHRYVGQHVRHR
jgi:hypothetical protein